MQKHFTINKTYSIMSDLESTIVINDLIKRYKIRKEVPFKIIVNYVLCSNFRIFSIRSTHRYMKNDFPNLSTIKHIKLEDFLMMEEL